MSKLSAMAFALGAAALSPMAGATTANAGVFLPALAVLGIGVAADAPVTEVQYWRPGCGGGYGRCGYGGWNGGWNGGGGWNSGWNGGWNNGWNGGWNGGWRGGWGWNNGPGYWDAGGSCCGSPPPCCAQPLPPPPPPPPPCCGQPAFYPVPVNTPVPYPVPYGPLK